MVRIDDLIYIMDEQLTQTVDENQKMAMTAVLEAKSQMIMYKDITKLFATLGIKDYPTPKGAQSALSYQDLTLKSIRTLNRMIYKIDDMKAFN